MTHVWHRKAAVGIHLIIWPHSSMASCSRLDHRLWKGSAGGSVCVLRADIRASTLSSCNEAWLTHSILLNTRQGNVVRATSMAFCFQFTKLESSYSNGWTKTGSALHFCHPADFSPSSPLWTRLCQSSSFCLPSLLFSVITVIIISILIWQCRTLHMLDVLEHLLVVNVQTQQQQTGVVCWADLNGS